MLHLPLPSPLLTLSPAGGSSVCLLSLTVLPGAPAKRVVCRPGPRANLSSLGPISFRCGSYSLTWQARDVSAKARESQVMMWKLENLT